MARKFLLTLALTAALIAAAAPSRAVTFEGCSDLERRLGVCASVAGGSVNLVGNESRAGQPGGPAGTAAGRDSRVRCLFAAWQFPELCNPASQATRPAIPTVTISDIATFIPTPGRQRMEPDGWTIAGLDTNFYAITGPHVVNGTLLGRPADVRFTPISYRWAYGDGTSATRSTPGATWAAQGIREFEPTPTSHVYEQVGDYTITLSIAFAAEYRFAGGPWRPVVGTITLPANDVRIRVGTAKTVLVEQDCAQNPAGPGC